MRSFALIAASTCFMFAAYAGAATDPSSRHDLWPTVSRDYDGNHVRVLDTTGAVAADYDFDRKQQAVTLTLANGLRFVVTRSNGYRTLLVTADGSVMDSRNVTPGHMHLKRRINLDIVRHDLGLGDDWMDSIRVDDTASTAKQVSTSTGDPLLDCEMREGSFVARDAHGHKLFHDVSVNFFQGFSQSAIDLVDLQGILPDHVVIASDGRIGAYVDGPARGTVSSFWTEPSASGKTFAFRADVQRRNQLTRNS